MVFAKGEKPEYLKKNPQSKGENELINSTHMKDRGLNQGPQR